MSLGTNNQSEEKIKSLFINDPKYVNLGKMRWMMISMESQRGNDIWVSKHCKQAVVGYIWNEKKVMIGEVRKEIVGFVNMTQST